MSNLARQPLYASASLTGYAPIFVSTEIFDVPIQLLVELEVGSNRLEFLDPSTSVTATVTDEFGNAMEGLDVAFASDQGTATPDNDTTDANGQVTTTFEYEVAVGFDVTNLLALVTPLEGYVAATTSVKMVGYNEPTTMTVTPETGYKTKKKTVTVEGTVSDPEGVDTIQLILDGGTPINVSVTANAFSYDLTDLSEGMHTLVIRAIDDQGSETEYQITFEVEKEAAEELPWLWIMIAIIVIIIIIIIVAVVMRSRAAPPMEEEEVPMEEEAPLEEEPFEEPMEEVPSEEAESETLSEE